MNSEKGTLNDLRIDRAEPTRRRFPWGLAVTLAILVSAIGGVAWWLARPRVPQVRTLVVRANLPGGQRTVLNASGYIVARREATVSSKVTGKVMDVLVEEGMKVKEGQILARLDDTNTRVALRLAEAQLAAAQSSLGETQARLDEAQKEHKRAADLAAKQIASLADLDRAEAELASLRARLERQRVEVTVAERQLEIWRQQMEDLVIRAPFEGVVTSKNAQPGEMISPVSAGGGFTRTGICTVVDMTSLEVEVDVNESYINRVQAGQAVESTLDAYQDWKIASKVVAIIPTADRQKATVKVRVGFEKLDPRMLPQMGVKVAFRSGADAAGSQASVMLPKQAIQPEGERQTVFVVKESRVERRTVTLGTPRGEELPVLTGLTDGEKIVISPPQDLKEGDRVEEAKR